MVRVLAAAFGCVLVASGAVPSAGAAGLPRPAHVVVVIEENHSFGQIADNEEAPFLNRLIRGGALFTDSHGVSHPSLPNYFALFAGRENDNGDGCPATGIDDGAANLGSALFAAHLTFRGYAESLPQQGFTGCSAGRYARKHAPWVQFSNLSGAANLPYAMFPAFDELPTVAFVVPNLDHDMHDGSVAAGDAWLSREFTSLVVWARTHNTLLIVTWDESFDFDNHIPTIFAGPMVKAGRYAEHVTHYRVLRTIEDMYGLPHLGKTGSETPIVDCWVAR